MITFVLTIITIVIIVGLIIIARINSQNLNVNEKIKDLWLIYGFETKILEEEFLGNSFERIVAIKNNKKYTLIGTNWAESKGRIGMPYWGIAIFFKDKLRKFSIVRRKPNVFDSERIKINDPELDKMMVLKCNDKDWFKKIFDVNTLRFFAQNLTTKTSISYKNKFPININNINSQFNLNLQGSFILIKKKEYITFSKNFSEIIPLTEKIIEIFLQTK